MWFFAVFKRQEVRLFERVTRDSKAVVEFGNQLAEGKSEKQVLELVAKITRPNQLFLTEANERNVEKLKPLMRWFRNNLVFIAPYSRYGYLELRAHTDKEFIDSLGKFLQQADTGIHQVASVQEQFDLNKHFPDMPEDLKQEIRNGLNANAGEKKALFIQAGREYFTIARDDTLGKEPVLLSLKMRHQTADGDTVDFDTKDESDGTNRMMHLLPSLLDLRASEKVYIIDELDRSMHPLLCRLFVETFIQNAIKGTSNGQLVFTTHETALLDLDLLRRDEIWFIEKDKDGGSHLCSLAEYRVRNDLKIDKGYLNGRFGAIPFIQQLSSSGDG